MIDGEACRVKVFTPWAKVENGRVIAASKSEPYGSILIESDRLSEDATGFVTHRVDFLHLWSAFNERGVAEDEELIVIWTKKHLKSHVRLVSKFMPRLWVMLCRKGAFDLMTNPDFKPDLSGVARWEAEQPLVEWKPDVIE